MFDKDAVMKHIQSAVKEAHWKPVMKTAAELCIKEVTEKKDVIIEDMAVEPFSIKKDQCNVIFMSLATCIRIESYKVFKLQA